MNCGCSNEVSVVGKAVAFTGHRPESLPFGENMDAGMFYEFKMLLQTEIDSCIAKGYDTFYCGGARGADIVCGEIIATDKASTHKNIKLICAIPFSEQAKGWSLMWKQRYQELLKAADIVRQLCKTYQRGCYHIRNRFMVDNSDLIIAIYDGGNTGGTAYTVNYARELGKEIVIINPHTLERIVIPAK